MVGGKNLFYSPKLAKKDIYLATKEEVSAAEEQSKTILLLKNADDKTYKDLKDDLKMGTYLFRNEYPTTIPSIYELMVKSNGGLNPRQANNQSINNNGNQRHQSGNSSAIFARQRVKSTGDVGGNELVQGKEGAMHDVMCLNYHHCRHYASSCPEQDRRHTGVRVLQIGACFTITKSKTASLRNQQ